MIKQIALSAVLLPAVCSASSPSSIPATYVDSNKFADQSCGQIIATKKELSAALVRLSMIPGSYKLQIQSLSAWPQREYRKKVKPEFQLQRKDRFHGLSRSSC